VIAKTIVFAEPAVSAAGLSASDIVAICSLVVAVLALGFSIVSAEVQRRHNVRMAKPHVEIDLGANKHLVRLANHGPGVARIQSFTATRGDLSFDLLSMTELWGFCHWLVSGIQNDPITLSRTCLQKGSYIAPNTHSDIVLSTEELSVPAGLKVMEKLNEMTFSLTVTSIYDKTYAETITASK
jgi:hypothetical protein